MFENIRREMGASRMSQAVLAKKIGMGEKTLGIKLSGKREFKRTEMLRISKELGQSLDYLFGESRK